MYNQTYEEYMRNILGYIPSNQDMEYTYRNDTNIYYNSPTSYATSNMNLANIDDLYPEIYKIVYPMVKKACANCRGEINETNVEKITMEVFTNVEVNIGTENEVNVQNRKAETKCNSKVEENRNKQENRNRNYLLKDLIRILVLRELLQENRPNRPPFIGPRPPVPGGQGPRPPFPSGPIQPRSEFLEYY